MAQLQSTTRLLILVTYVLSSHQANVTLRTRLGRIRGTMTPDYRSLGPVYKFYNIPFAKPPTGNLRFTKPQPYGSWRGILDATKVGPACMQEKDDSVFHYNGYSEDCLQLNIYIPHNINSTNTKSVMVWIHGGGYQTGSGTVADGSQIAILGDVIVVTINYRLGFLGFMSFGNRYAKGNYGLWDQILALTWIKYNIADYGGNPNDVTIFGESAGGFSVGLQTLIPSNRGLFHRAIMQSGTADSFYAYEKSSNVSTVISEMVGCPTTSVNSDSDLMNCLRLISAETLVNKSSMYFNEQGFSYYAMSTRLGPVQDNELFHKDPAILLADPSSSEFNFFQSLDIMVGNCDMEGSILLYGDTLLKDEYGVDIRDGIPTRIICDVFGRSIANLYYSNPVAVSDAICKKYTVLNDLAEQGRYMLHMFNDVFFLSGAVATLRSHSSSLQGTSTYQYIFTEENVLNFVPKHVPSWFSGSGHGTDIIYLFYMDSVVSSNHSVSRDYLNFSNKISLYWTNFAKTGDPNGPGLPRWLPYDQSSDHPFLQLNSHNISTGWHYRESWQDFWIRDLPKIAQIKNNVVGK